MNDIAQTKQFGGLAQILAGFGGISLLINSFTQMVGAPLGATIAASFVSVSTAAAIHFGYRWRRSAFLLFHPVSLWLLVTGSGHVFLALIGLLIYLYGIVRFVAAGSHASLAFSPDGPGTLGGLFSLCLMIVSTFVFGWWWTNFSSSFYLFAQRDFQGIGVCLLFLGTSAIIASIALGVWWRHRWRLAVGVVVLFTGIALGIHALYYSAVSVSATTGRAVASMTGGTVGAIILGRFVFALVALVFGWTLLRRR